MKKNVIALAIAAAVAAPAANAAPTVYGQINMVLESVETKNAGTKDKANSGMQVNSVASRLGVKGSEDLGSGLKAVYKLEFGVNIDDDKGTGNSLTSRNQFVGLAGGFGTVLMGRHDTPFKMAQPKDLFNDGRADNNPMASGLGVSGKGGEDRVAETLAYVSPSFGGVKLAAAFVPKENGGDATKESSITDVISLAAMYGSKKKGLYLGAGYNNYSKNATGTESATELRLTAQYVVAGLVANAMYQDFSGDAIKGTVQEGTNMMVNVGYKMGKFMPKLKYSMNDYKDKAFEDSTGLGLGVDYKMGKKTTGYAQYIGIDNVGGTKKSSVSTIQVGLLHKF